MRLLYLGPFDLPTGYGQAARGYREALSRLVPSLCARSHLKESDLPWVPTHVLLHATPGALTPLRAHYSKKIQAEVPWIAMTTWETSSLPHRFVEELSKFDRVIVPSKVCRKQVSGVMTRISVVPHILETDGPEPWRWPPPINSPGPFVFLWHGDWSERKNPIGALKAYWHAFSPGDNVLLRMKLPAFDALTVQALKDRVNKPVAPVEFITDHLPQAALVELYRSADVFLTLSRGDAWGFPAFHAASQGLPVIFSENVGHQEFLWHQAGGSPVQTMPTPAFSGQTFLTTVVDGGLRMTVSEPEGVSIDQLWREPRLDMAALAMQTQRERGSFQAENDFLPRFSSENVGRELVSLLEDTPC